MEYPGSLHGHTEYSNNKIRDSINTYKTLIDYAISLGQEVIAITEHECVSNVIKVNNYYKKIKEEHPNFKVIFGNEIYLCRDDLTAETYIPNEDKFYHFILLAKDAIGHKQIRELSTRAWRRAFEMRRQFRTPTYYSDLEDVIGPNPGHVIASSACLGSFLDQKLLQYLNTKDQELYAKIENWCYLIEEIFGKGNFYLELQPEGSMEQKAVNQELVKLAEKIGFKYIITCDEHYLRKEDAPIHEAFLKAQEGDREVASFYSKTYLMGTEELEQNLSITKEQIEFAYKNILEIKEQCEDFDLCKPLKIPILNWKTTENNKADYTKEMPALKNFMTSDFEGDRLLGQIVTDEFFKREELRTKEMYDAVNESLEMTWISSEINKVHWSSYFLNLQKIVDECWAAGTLVGAGRGSGIGFALLYILGITQINPVWETTKTYPWRFLNPSRVSVLDVDIDIEGGKRSTVLNHLRQAYGEDRVANVVTFKTETSKQAIQTAARGLGINNDIALSISALIPADRGQIRTLKECYYGDKEKGFRSIPQFVNLVSEYPDLWKVAQSIEGLVCGIGEHAGGVIFVDEPFTETTALMRVPNGDLVTQYDLHDCEDVSQP